MPRVDSLILRPAILGPIYKGPFSYGMINEEFDRKIVDLMSQGKGAELGRMTSQDLLDNGEIELRSWITLLGALGDTPAKVLAYEPFYSAPMAMAVAYWDNDETYGVAQRPAP